MRSRTVVMIALAMVFGVMALFAAQKWVDRQSSRMREPQLVARPPMQTIVVAAIPFRFGTEITRQHLREISWPEGAVPKGAFAKIDEVIDGQTRRVALSAVEENEPVLAAKITGPGQRGSLAAVIAEGMKAVTVRVNDVNGVAGFVLPGERVDVLLIRNLDKSEAYSDVLLQNVKVLAADQSADERSDKPAVVKAVTLEVTTADAQKLTLAAAVGSLALSLRSAGTARPEVTRRVAVDDLARPDPQPLTAYVSTAESAPQPPRTTTVGVFRGMKRQEYSVPSRPVAHAVETTTASVIGPKP